MGDRGVIGALLMGPVDKPLMMEQVLDRSWGIISLWGISKTLSRLKVIKADAGILGALMIPKVNFHPLRIL